MLTGNGLRMAKVGIELEMTMHPMLECEERQEGLHKPIGWEVWGKNRWGRVEQISERFRTHSLALAFLNTSPQWRDAYVRKVFGIAPNG